MSASSKEPTALRACSQWMSGTVRLAVLGLLLLMYPVPVSGQTEREIEDLFWRSVECEKAPEVQVYLEVYPEGAYVTEAWACLEGQLGLERADRILVQQGLTALDYAVGAADGLFGPATRAALRQWQAGKGFTATGYLTRAQAETLMAQGREAEAVRRAAEARRQAEGTRTRETGRQREEEAQKRWQTGKVFRDCPRCPEMMVVPAETFLMGSPSYEAGRPDDEGPVRQVTIGQPFAVGVYEVTVGEYGRFVGATGYAGGNSCRTYKGGTWEERSGRSWRDPGFRQTEREPVVCVNWRDAHAYAEWLSRETGQSYRLLSEAEWEYMARAGRTTARHWGEGEEGQCRYGNGADQAAKRHHSGWTVAACDDGRYTTAPVGTYRANRFGLHDVLGNVWEWVQDCWNENYGDAPRDGRAWESGDCSRRVRRGGSWNSEPRYLRSANRGRNTTDYRSSVNGFRIARSLP